MYGNDELACVKWMNARKSDLSNADEMTHESERSLSQRQGDTRVKNVLIAVVLTDEERVLRDEQRSSCADSYAVNKSVLSLLVPRLST